MAVLRLEALRALKAAIIGALPELVAGGKDHVFIGEPPPPQKLCFPSLVIDPVRFKFMPDQAADFSEPSPSHVVMVVGRWDVTIQLRLACATKEDRWDYEERLAELFVGAALRPGVLLTPVTACTSLGEFTAAWELDEDEWQDEKIFDTQFWSMAVLDGHIPALVTRAGAYTIEDLRLGLSHDFTALVTPENSGTSSPTVEVVRVNQDGTFVKV